MRASGAGAAARVQYDLVRGADRAGVEDRGAGRRRGGERGAARARARAQWVTCILQGKGKMAESMG